MRYRTLLVLPVLAGALAAQVAQPPGPAPQTPASGVRRAVYEGVVALQGKTIGTSILLEIGEKPGADGSRPVGGWIQRNDFYPIDSGSATADHVIFTSGANQYDINLNTMRISYSGRDGSGNQRLEKMSYAEGRVYKLTEEADEQRTMTLQISGDEKDFLVGEPTVWKRNGPPLIHFNRLEEILGKTTGFWLSRYGTTRYVAIMEEPPGMDLQKKAPKEKKDKRKK